MNPATNLMTALTRRNMQLLPVIVMIIIVMALLTDSFMSTQNVINLGNRVSINLIIAAGMTLLITAGGIDLSVGSTAGLSAMVAAIYFQRGRPWGL